ncbi:MAG TPA: response regulator transcription factor, partial [Thermodesulfovibrionales bacterium]|nr:response regulator transcription factor [Thermodesulfovibrionales bacterium]
LEASKYSEAIGHLKERIDLALIDYALPDRDGFEVLRAIREVKPSLPAIMMTAYSSENVVIKALRVGATDYIRKPLSFAYLMKRLSQILGGHLEVKLNDDAQTREEFIMEGVAAYIEDKYREDLTLDQLAAMACMNRFKFCRAFKKKLGQSFISYLSSIRVNKAEKLLREHRDLNITEIALAVGYGNVGHFGRVFRTVYGVSPTEYRRRHWGDPDLQQ